MRETNLTEEKRSHAAKKVTIVGFMVNATLTIIKILAGIMGQSGAMLADGIHSLSDFFTDIAVIIGFKFAAKPADDDHNYGHGKYETLATVTIGIALFLVGYNIFSKGLLNVYDVVFNNKTIARPGAIAFVAALFSILAKEFLYRYTKAIGERIKSPSVIANGWHHRSDALSSVGTLIGIGGAFLLGEQWTVLDPLASIVVSFFIFKVAIEIAIPAFNELLESSLSKDDKEYIQETLGQLPEIRDYHHLRTRRIGGSVAIEAHIVFDRTILLYDAHEVSDIIEHRLKKYFGDACIITMHLEPQKS